MDAIKKKMQAMKLEKDNAMDKADTCEQQARDANLRAEKVNEEVRELQKKLAQVEEDLILNKNKLDQANKDLEEREKQLTATEAEVAAMNRKVQQIEEDLEKSEERSGTAQQKLLEAQQSADENNRMCKVLENRAQQDEERMDQLTNQLKEARLLAEDADGKSDEVSRKLAFVEDELEVAEDRVKSGDAKISELEEELKVVGNSLKSLEVSEEKANQRVEEFKKQLKTLTGKLKEAEARAEYAEKTVKKLQKEVDRLEAGEWHSPTFWVFVCGAIVFVSLGLAAVACWISRRRNSLAHKLGNKRGPDKALVFQPPRRATAVRSPGSATHYLRKSPSPTASAPPSATTPPQPHPPQNPPSVHTSPSTPTAPETAPLSKELADANATEKTKTEPEPTNDGKLGDLHFKLRYENEKSALVVSVVSCQGLPGREPAGPDPYVKLQLLPDKQHKVKTRVVRKTRCPVYDEDFTFYGIAPHQISAITLHFVVLSFDRYSRDEIIGEVVSPLSNLQLQSGEAMALCREIQPRSLKMRSVGRGEVLVSLCWQPAAARLTVVLLKARNLPKMDVTGLADPYVKMYLLYNGQRIAKKKTHVKKRTLNPVFNESFVFEVPAAPNATLDHVSLELLVLDWDRLTKNEVIGRLELGAAGSGSARHHWREVQAAPRRQIADWHKLKE